MDRITRRIGESIVFVDGKGYTNLYHGEKLRLLFERLAKYEELDEQRRLIKLPCKVGDKVYRIAVGRHIEDMKVKSFEIDEEGVFIRTIYRTPISYVISSYPIEDLFFTKEEAEKALKEFVS